MSRKRRREPDVQVDVPPRWMVPSRLTPRSLALRVLVVLPGLLLVADLPGWFTRGDVLRGALLPLVAALTLAVAVLGGAPAPRLFRGGWVVLALPMAVWLVSLPGTTSAALSSPSALARGALPWLSLPALALGLLMLSEEHERLLERVWRALLVLGAAAGLWVFLDGTLRSAAGAGPFGRPGVAGPLLGALLGPALAWGVPRRLPLRVAVVTLIAAGLAASHSRTGWAAGALSLLLALGLSPHLVLPRLARRVSLALAAVGALLAALLLVGALEAPGSPPTLAVRQGVWRAATALVAERPVVGHGLGSFRSEVLRRRDLEEARLSRGREPFMAHNDVLHAAAEGGLPAGALLALFLLGSLGVAWRAQRRRPDALGALAVAVLAAQLAAGLAEQVLPDPAHVPLAALALATALRPERGAPAGRVTRLPPRPLSVAALLLCAALLAVGLVKTRDLLADAHLTRHAQALRRADGLAPESASAAASTHLVEGVLRWRPDHADGWVRLGVSEARLGRLAPAREHFRRALALEPGLTEARLNLAQTYVDEGRPGDATVALEEARRFDPTRYDVLLRLGHVAYGVEPVPDLSADTSFTPFECWKRYNRAQELAPERFETAVAYARVWRRTGDLAKAGDALREATRLAAAFLAGADGSAAVPGEVLLESFCLAEAEGRASELEVASILTLALAADPLLRASVLKQATRAEAAGQEREALAQRAAPELTAPDYASAERAYGALTLRLLGLLSADLLDADDVLREARERVEVRAFRAALARQRALLVYVGESPPEEREARIAFYERRGNLLIEAAQVATRCDGALSRAYSAEGHLLTGMELLERGRFTDARRLLALAQREAPEDARPCVALARALVGLALPDDAEDALLEALRRRPAVAHALSHEPDLRALLERPALRAALEAALARPDGR